MFGRRAVGGCCEHLHVNILALEQSERASYFLTLGRSTAIQTNVTLKSKAAVNKKYRNVKMQKRDKNKAKKLQIHRIKTSHMDIHI